MDERDEQEIETRLRAALLARSELVTHQRLRPGIPPNAHTAGAKAKRSWSLSWRNALIPVSVAAALAGGVFVGTQLPNHDADHGAINAGSGPGPQSSAAPSASPSSSPTATQAAPHPGATDFAGLSFQVAADWRLTPLDGASACVQPKDHAAPDPGATLPCGVDALWIQTGAAADAWPVGTAKDKEGWWPKATAGSGGGKAPVVPCPAGKPTSRNPVTNSVVFRTDSAFPVAGATADYREWSVTCQDGSVALPRLWQLGGAKAVAVTAVSVNARYDTDLLGIVATMHAANG